MTEKLCLILNVMLIIGCATSPSWVSHPAIQITDKAAFKVQLEPLARDKNYFVAFRLTVFNKTAKPLAIDWNKTRYVHNDRNNGGFVFKGIDPQLMKKAALPVEIIPAGETLTKELIPYKLLARGPIRDKKSKVGWHGIIPGIIPAGQNGVRLVMRCDDQAVRFKINVTMKKGVHPDVG